MGTLILDVGEEEFQSEREPEPKVVIDAGSQAVAPSGKRIVPSGVSSQVINPIPINPADMAKMIAMGKEKFSVYEVKVNDLVHEATELIVSDQTTHDQAVELGLKAKKLGKEIGEREKSYTKYANDFVRGLRSFVKPFTDGCDRIEAITKSKNRDWMALRELERRKQEKILADAQRQVQAKVDAEAKAAGVDTVQIPEAILKKEEKVITRTASGSAHLRASKDFKILNLSLVPREYLERAIGSDPDKFLRPVIKEELKRNPDFECDGLLIFESSDIVYRT